MTAMGPFGSYVREIDGQLEAKIDGYLIYADTFEACWALYFEVAISPRGSGDPLNPVAVVLNDGQIYVDGEPL